MSSYYKFTKGLKWKKLLETAFDLSSGHNHDGVNSRGVTFPADYALADGKIIIGSVSNVGAAKTPSGDVTMTREGVTAIGAAKVTPEMQKTAGLVRFQSFQVEDLAADGDITDRVLFMVPAGIDITLTKVSIIPMGGAVGVDNSNTSVIVVKNGANTIVSKTYNAGTAFPSSGVEGDLGALDGTYKAMAAGSALKLSVTNGSTANLPSFMLQIAYTIATAV